MKDRPDVDLCYVATRPTCSVQVVLTERARERALAEIRALGWKATTEGLVCPECRSRRRREER